MQAKDFMQRYRFDSHKDLIAEGTYSRVFKAYDKLLQREICVKLFRKEFVTGSPLVKELSRAGVFFHPNICAFYDLLEIEETNVLGEVEPQPIGILEYMNGGTITSYLSQHSDLNLRRKLIKDVLNGLVYLHSLNQPHYDLKPENILVKDDSGNMTAKITDFLNSENLHTRSAPNSISPESLAYKAPEYFESNKREVTTKADIWALGLIVYEIFTGKKLFYQQDDTSEKIIRNICYGDYYPALHELPEPFKLFCEKCLIRDDANRNVSLEELLMILQMPAAAPFEAKAVAPKEAEVTSVILNDTKAPELPVAEAVTQAPNTPKKRRALVIPLLLLGLGGFAAVGFWKLQHREEKEVQNTTSEIRAAGPVEPMVRNETAAPTIIHDTVKLVQLVQSPAQPAVAAASPVKVTRTEMPAATHNSATPILPEVGNMWVGKPYYFDLKTPLLSDEEYQLYSEEAAITALGQNTFYVKPMQAGEIFVAVMSKKDSRQIASKKYHVKDQKLPVASIGDDIFGGFVSPKLLLAKLTLQAKSESGNYKIRSFHMSCKSGSCDVEDVSNSGHFNESMIKTLRNVKPGEKLYFDNIIAEDEQGQTVRLNDIQVTTY
ncbi:MAG: protein kinase [Chitinophagales bacterium]